MPRYYMLREAGIDPNLKGIWMETRIILVLMTKLIS